METETVSGGDVESNGPVYGVKLLKSLPLGNGMSQAMPGRSELIQVRQFSERTVAGLEVLTARYRQSQERVIELEDAINGVISGNWTVAGLQEIIGDIN